MVDVVSSEAGIPRPDHPLNQTGGAKWFLPTFGGLVLVGVIYVGYALSQDLAVAKTVPWILLGMALLIALGFEFVNGFHDTANAVATVIYTHSLPPNVAVVWSGLFNFLGVLFSSGAVAFGIISLLPVELILQVGSGAGFAMVFALLIAAILWNLGTWCARPAGFELAHADRLDHRRRPGQPVHGAAGSATSGVDWAQASNIGMSLLVSPLVGFCRRRRCCSCVMKLVVRNPGALRGAEGQHAAAVVDPRPADPHLHRRLFAHGSNDGQKGMGLIMLILIGAVPTAYALNRTMPDSNYLEAFKSAAAAQSRPCSAHTRAGASRRRRRRAAVVSDAVRTKTWTTRRRSGAAGLSSRDIGDAGAALRHARQGAGGRWSATSATTCTWSAKRCSCSTRRSCCRWTRPTCKAVTDYHKAARQRDASSSRCG